MLLIKEPRAAFNRRTYQGKNDHVRLSPQPASSRYLLVARPIGVSDAAAAVSLTVPASSTFWPALLAKVLALAGLLLAGFPASAAPSIGSVQITPDAIAAGMPTTVRVTAVIADPTLLPATVNLQRVNEAGAAVAVLGSLHDDGRNGDAVAGDQVYTLDVVLTETSPLRLRVSAGFQGMVKRVFSAEVLLPINRPPLADAGPDQSVARGKRVSLDGSASRDPEGATLSHTWSLIDRPAGSAATLTDANSVRPTFTADVPGQYIAQLIVRDGPLASAPDTVRITVTDPGLTILYLHADHLGTPRVATNEANVVVWRNLPISEPFGMALPEEDPDGDGQPTIINLRFPGQYFDRETQLHYNYYRDYDPGTGRYVQPDLIGLAGGLNLYTYVLGNPVWYTDPSGLICTYSQATGLMVCQNNTTGAVYYSEQGYAGTGSGRDNSSAQGQQNVGPIPRGDWRTGSPYNSPNTGTNTIALTPMPGNSCPSTGRDCSSFRAHGNNAANDASHGCIILPPNRTNIPPGEIIRVISGDD
jgi:RHS repeat-associated protein